MPETTAKLCQNCHYAICAMGLSRPILICKNKEGSETNFFVIEPKASCKNFQTTRKISHPPKPPAPANGARLIPLTQGKFAIVDLDDYERLAKYKWSASQSRYNFYACRRTRGKKISMHRLIANAPAGLLVDHIDGDGLNNRKANLRLCSITQNNRNRGPNRRGTSKYKGVSWSQCCRKWFARIRPNRRTIYLGLFTNEIEAALAYDRKAEELFGEFAYLNFPQLKEFKKHLKILFSA